MEDNSNIIIQAAPEVTPAPQKLSKEERSQVAREAAQRRWAKAKKEAGKRAKSASKTAKARKSSGPREFSSAMKVAERRLAKAIEERAQAATLYAIRNAEIPSLQKIIVALRNPNGALPEFGVSPALTLEQIVGEQPLAYANPPRTVAAVPVPQPLHPANQQANRAQGGAVGVALDEDSNEDAFLKDSPMAGGQWR